MTSPVASEPKAISVPSMQLVHKRPAAKEAFPSTWRVEEALKESRARMTLPAPKVFKVRSVEVAESEEAKSRSTSKIWKVEVAVAEPESSVPQTTAPETTSRGLAPEQFKVPSLRPLEAM